MKDKKPLKITISAENSQEFFGIYRISRTYINISQNIPFSLVARLYNIMYEETNYNSHTKWNESEKYSSIALDKIKLMTVF